MSWRWIYALWEGCLCFGGLDSIKPWKDKDAKGNDAEELKTEEKEDLETAEYDSEAEETTWRKKSSWNHWKNKWEKERKALWIAAEHSALPSIPSRGINVDPTSCLACQGLFGWISLAQKPSPTLWALIYSFHYSIIYNISYVPSISHRWRWGGLRPLSL